MPSKRAVIGPQGKWFVRELARKFDTNEDEVRDGLEQLIERGHVKILLGEGPNGCDLFELVVKEHVR